MQTRLWRLQNDCVDDISNYDEEETVDFEDLNTEDYSVEYPSTNYINEETALVELIAEAQNCIAYEQDAKLQH